MFPLEYIAFYSWPSLYQMKGEGLDSICLTMLPDTDRTDLELTWNIIRTDMVEQRWG